MFAKSLISTVALAALALAQSATIIVEASHGGAGQGLTNTTITVPLGTPFTGNAALKEVSTLFLEGAAGVDVNSVVCTPFESTDGTGSSGRPFLINSPSFLSTNTVQVGSIVCTSGSQSAIVVVEASHGGAGQGLTNTTVLVPLGTPFTGDAALQAVSTLFLVAGENVDVSAVTCTPFKNTDGTGSGGLPFTVSSPSLLSTNTVQVGSIVCNISPSGSQSAIVVVEASHGGAGQGLTNSTILVPLGAPFTGDAALKEVSTLFLVAAENADVSTITCTPFKNTDGTGSGGLPFTVSTPSFLSTNTVQIGSILCTGNSESTNGASVTRRSAKWRNL